MILTTNYHPDWQVNRINYIISLYGEDFFKDKKILELGPYNGCIGAHFQSIGGHVTSVEGRLENVKNIKKDYPNIENVIHHNLDTPDWNFGYFDIIINFGLYYHLQNYHKEHLTNCINNCDIMFFESVIYDSNEPKIHFTNEIGPDQSLSKVGGSPSLKYIENIFNENNVIHEMHSSSSLNGDGHTYDCVSNYNNIHIPTNRRFFIIKNK